MKFYAGQKFGNENGIRINVLDVEGDYARVECYDINDTLSKTEGFHSKKLLEEHLIEFNFEEIK